MPPLTLVGNSLGGLSGLHPGASIIARAGVCWCGPHQTTATPARDPRENVRVPHI